MAINHFVLGIILSSFMGLATCQISFTKAVPMIMITEAKDDVPAVRPSIGGSGSGGFGGGLMPPKRGD